MNCKSTKDYLNSNNNRLEVKSEPKILFLNYNIKKTKNDHRTIEFINKKIKNGTLKRNTFETIENGMPGDLVFIEFDKKQKALNKILIKNPLIKNVEYLDASKHFKMKVINFDHMQFSIRLQLKNNTKYITISNFVENKPLIKTKIR